MKAVLFLILILNPLFSVGQIKYDQSIKNHAELLRKAELTKDFEKLTLLALPAIVKKSGGKDLYRADLLREHQTMKNAGLKIKDLIIHSPSKVVAASGDLQAMLPYERHISNGTDLIKEEHFYLIVSQDHGETWSFTDMKKYDKRSLKIFVPNYNERLNIFLNSVKH